MSCPDCFQGHVHEGETRGQLTKLYGLDTYVTEPTGGKEVKGIIVIISDGFGLPFINNKILADHYADKGPYKVYLPDFMAGCPLPIWLIPTLKSLMTPGNWLTKPYYAFWGLWGLLPWFVVNRPAKSYPRVTAFFEKLRTEEPNLPVGAAGFCWGGKHVVLLARGTETVEGGRHLFDAGFTGHPSMLEVPGDVEKMTLPVAFAVGDKDHALPAEQVEKIRAVVEEKLPEAARGEVRSYEGAGHGFCVRADLDEDAVMARCAAEAEDFCIEWFNSKLNISS